MPGPALHEFADLVAATLNELGPYDAVQQIAQRKTDYECLSRWMTEDKVMLESSMRVQRTLMTGDGSNGPARHAAPTDEDQVNLSDILKQIVVPLVHADTSWFVVRQHVLANRKPSAILNVIKAARNWAMLSMHEEMERKCWGPAPPSTNTTDPWAVKYWIVQNSATGFHGGSPTGDNMIAGLNLSTLPVSGQFNSYSGTYAQLTPQDGITKLRTMKLKTGFKSPVSMKDYTQGRGDRYRIYCNETTLQAFQNILYSNADLSLRDVAQIDPLNILFNGNPIVYIDTLNDDSNNPIYFINHDTFLPMALDGDYLYESRNMAPKQHNIEQYFVDLTYNFECVDRRRNGVLYQSP